MDPFHYHQAPPPPPPPPPQLKPYQAEKCNNNNNYLCRQTSTRWIPTSEQIRILRDLYYNCGVRSPSSEEIQRISATLRKYGKIEGKNVFYWFQNHKARERQKKRTITAVDVMKPNCNGDLVSPGALTPPAVGASSTPSSSASLYGVALAPTENINAFTTVPMLMERNLNIDFNNMINGNGEVWQMPLHTEQSSAAVAVTRELETLQLFPVKTSPAEQEPSNMQQLQFNSPNQPQFSSNLVTSCCNPHGFYYQKQENQCMYYSEYLQPAALELTLGSYLVSPPNYNYPGPM